MQRAIVFVIALLAAGSITACADATDDDSANNAQQVDTSRATMTAGDSFFVEYTPSPDPIPHNELFTLDVSVWKTSAKETAVTDAEVAVDVNMPAHGHGMNTEPTVSSNGDGTFEVAGMKLHMESPTPAEKWVMDIEVTDAETTESASFNIICCGEQ